MNNIGLYSFREATFAKKMPPNKSMHANCYAAFLEVGYPCGGTLALKVVLLARNRVISSVGRILLRQLEVGAWVMSPLSAWETWVRH
jgi:hypothetical protein